MNEGGAVFFMISCLQMLASPLLRARLHASWAWPFHAQKVHQLGRSGSSMTYRCHLCVCKLCACKRIKLAKYWRLGTTIFYRVVLHLCKLVAALLKAILKCCFIRNMLFATRSSFAIALSSCNTDLKANGC